MKWLINFIGEDYIDMMYYIFPVILGFIFYLPQILTFLKEKLFSKFDEIKQKPEPVKINVVPWFLCCFVLMVFSGLLKRGADKLEQKSFKGEIDSLSKDLRTSRNPRPFQNIPAKKDTSWHYDVSGIETSKRGSMKNVSVSGFKNGIIVGNPKIPKNGVGLAYDKKANVDLDSVKVQRDMPSNNKH